MFTLNALTNSKHSALHPGDTGYLCRAEYKQQNVYDAVTGSENCVARTVQFGFVSSLIRHTIFSLREAVEHHQPALNWIGTQQD